MSEKHQFVDNPLLLTDLFSKGVYYFGEATEASPVGAQQVDGESISEVIDSANGAVMPPAESDISTKKGEEILLYFLERGDTCASSFASAISNGKCGIRAIAEKESEIIDTKAPTYPTIKRFGPTIRAY